MSFLYFKVKPKYYTCEKDLYHGHCKFYLIVD